MSTSKLEVVIACRARDLARLWRELAQACTRTHTGAGT